MTETKAKTLVAAILSTLFEMSCPICPASSIYMALGMDISDYQAIAYILNASGLANVTSDTISLTKLGLEFGEKLSV